MLTGVDRKYYPTACFEKTARRGRPWMPWKMGLKGQRGGMYQFIYLPSAPVLVASGKQPIAGIQREEGTAKLQETDAHQKALSY